MEVRKNSFISKTNDVSTSFLFFNLYIRAYIMICLQKFKKKKQFQRMKNFCPPPPLEDLGYNCHSCSETFVRNSNMLLSRNKRFILNEIVLWNAPVKMCVCFFLFHGSFCNISLNNFVEHNPHISEE